MFISEDKYLDIYEGVTVKLLTGEQPGKLETVQDSGASVVKLDKVGIIPIRGTLVSHNATGDSGVLSYETIANNTRSMLDNGVTTIVYTINSYGGEADGAMGLAKFIAKLPELYDVKTVALVDGPCCSAAYLLASGTQTILASQSALLGSVAVIGTLFSQEKKDKKDGEDWVIIRSLPEKALNNPHEPITDARIAEMQDKIDNLGNLLIETVATNRPKLTRDKLVKLSGRTLLGNAALDYGLVDAIIDSVDIAIEQLRRGTFMSEQQTEVKIDAIAASAPIIPTISSVIPQVDVAAAIQQERTRCLGILEAAKTFGLTSDVAAKQIGLSTTVEQSIAMFEAIKEAVQMAVPTPVANAGLPNISSGVKSAMEEWVTGNDILSKSGTDTFTFR